MSTKGLIDSAVEHLRTSTGMKTVFGEPVRVDGKTFIPIAKVSPKESPEGGGAPAEPIGVVQISEAETKYLAFGQTKRLAWVAAISAAIGVLVGRFSGRGTER
ncbi:MAG TPA: hypothetical protein VGU74_05470 [Gemmatimonadales bacterium]|nr:hypothetical protein [Gemmatimonadales bacterium]